MEYISSEQLNRYIEADGMILLNHNMYYPNLEDYCGNWDTIMKLIEDRKVFFSKFYKKRTTYLSKELYFCIKPFKQDMALNSVEQAIFDLLMETDGVDTEFIKNSLLIDKKVFDQAMSMLLKNVKITVLNKGKQLTDNWSTFVWGTFLQWEKGVNWSNRLSEKEARVFIDDKLGRFLTKRQIDNLLK